MLRDRVRRLRRAGRQLQKTMCQGNRVEYRAAVLAGPAGVIKRRVRRTGLNAGPQRVMAP